MSSSWEPSVPFWFQQSFIKELDFVNGAQTPLLAVPPSGDVSSATRAECPGCRLGLKDTETGLGGRVCVGGLPSPESGKHTWETPLCSANHSMSEHNFLPFSQRPITSTTPPTPALGY